MKNKLLLIMIAELIAGCTDKVELETALKDPVTLNLVKQSIVEHQPIQVSNYYNGCSLVTMLNFPLSDKPIACDALNLRLNKKGILVSASSLVAYYMNEQDEVQEKAENQRIKDEAAAKQLLIENMANGK